MSRRATGCCGLPHGSRPAKLVQPARCLAWKAQVNPRLQVVSRVCCAGADVLFLGGGTEVGITVSPIRIKSLEQFGTPQFVGDKLLGAERSKARPYVCLAAVRLFLSIFCLESKSWSTAMAGEHKVSGAAWHKRAARSAPGAAI